MIPFGKAGSAFVSKLTNSSTVMAMLLPKNALLWAVADLEIFSGGFSFTKTPAKLEVKTKKKGLHQLFESSFSSSSKFTL